MQNYDVNLGIGLATGMAFHAPQGTALPDYPGQELSSDWVEIGHVSEDGISFGPNRELEPLRNWAKEIERLMAADGDETVEAPFITNTAETLKTLFGEDAVTVTEADSNHGNLIKLEVSPDYMPDGEAFLFLMKDGDDLIMLGTTKGFVTSVGDVDFAPDGAITWTATISAHDWTYMKNDQATPEVMIDPQPDPDPDPNNL